MNRHQLFIANQTILRTAQISLLAALLQMTPQLHALPSNQFGDNFDNYSAGASAGGFSVGGNTAVNDWKINGSTADKQYRAILTNQTYAGGGTGCSVRGIPYLGGLHRKNFTLSSQIKVTSLPGSCDLGLVAMAGSQPYYLSSSPFYWFGTNRTGALFIRSSVSGTSGLVLGTATNLSGGLVAGTNYTFTVTGTYNSSGVLTLNFTITGGANTASLTATAATPLTGANFGYHCIVGPVGANLTLEMDNFTASVPMTFTQFWADEFNGTSLDRTVWSTGYRWADVINNELQGMRPENVVVGNGLCTINATKPAAPVKNQTMTGYEWGAFDYASGAIQTYDKWTKTYGYFEARLKMTSGKGTWPAFWLLPDRGPSYSLNPRVQVGDTSGGTSIPMGSEIDILEYMAAWENASTGLSQAHNGLIWAYGTTGNAKGGYSAQNDGFGPALWYNADGQFHTYGMHWEPGVVTFYLDDKVVLAVQNAAKVPVCPEYMILNVSITQNDWHGNTIPLSTITAEMPSRMEIDYVRVYNVTMGAPSGGTTRGPVADLFVRDGASAGANYGTATGLTVKSDVASYNREAFLRFSATGLASAPSVKLRLVPISMGTQGSTVPLNCEFVASDTWSETGTTWSNKPAGSGTVLSSQSGPFAIGQPMEFDVTNQARAAASGDGLISFRIYSTQAGSDRVIEFGSKENATASYRPVLVY